MNNKIKIINFLNKLDSKPKIKHINYLITKFKIKLPKNKKLTIKDKYNYIKKLYNIDKFSLKNEMTIKQIKNQIKQYHFDINNIGNKKKDMFNYLEKIQQNHKQISAGYFTNIGKRDYQEDRMIIYNNFYHYISGVFDGHAGPRCSSYLKKNFYKTFIKNYHTLKKPIDTLFRTYFELDKKFLKIIDGNDGSTANILFCNKSTKQCYIANTGDSRAILCRKNGSISQISKDHKPNEPKERKRIESKGGFVQYNRTNGNLAMSRAFGDKNLKQVLTVEPEIFNFPYGNIRYIVQASDGLFDVLSNSEVCSFINLRLRKGITLDIISRDLVMYAINTKGSMDNTSVIITMFE